MSVRILVGDCRASLATLPERSVQTCVTSPPYFGLRDYGHAGQLGLEQTPDAYVAAMVDVFRAVQRVLRDDGTLWLNLGDSYANDTKWGGSTGGKHVTSLHGAGGMGRERRTTGLKSKDLIGVPWRVAFALQQPYYAGTIRNEVDRAWLAAMLDAEGCLFIHKRKAGQHNGQGYHRKNDNYGPCVEICNTSLRVVERIAALVGKGSISTSEKGRHGRKQTLYRWNLRTTESREFVREVYPFLVAKQQQARILYGCPSSGERAEAAHAALIGLHNGVETDVDFPPPLPMMEPGYYLRSDVIWSKSNPMPESVTDRPTKAHEYVFLLSKSERYTYDADAIQEESAQGPRVCLPSRGNVEGRGIDGTNDRHQRPAKPIEVGTHRNARSVWTIATQPYSGAHFATMPPALAERCILAGTSPNACETCGAAWVRVVEREKGEEQAHQRPKHLQSDKSTLSMSGGSAGWQERGSKTTDRGFSPTCACETNTGGGRCVVLDPFGGAGTTALVADRLGRDAILCELNPDYARLADDRIRGDNPLFADVRQDGAA